MLSCHYSQNKKQMKNPNTPILFIMSGLPASGKSTLSKLIAQRFQAVYLRIDTVEQGLRDLCNLKVEGEGYRLSYRIAQDNLQLGLNVVADSCNSIALTRNEWEAVAKVNDSFFINIEVICSSKNEHKTRAETRKSEITHLKLPTWNDIEKREYHPWDRERIIVDTANKSVLESINELVGKVYQYLDKKYEHK
ncbi:MAG TPA: kinase [Microscillaceae bacterium]|nr:kinase [Microscillaceae bacterium]